MNSSDDFVLYSSLLDAVLDSTASEAELRQFESVVLRSPEIRRDFACRLAERSELLLWDFQALPAKDAIRSSKSASNVRMPSTQWWQMAAISILSVFAVIVSASWLNGDKSCASIVETLNCEWGETSFPTKANQRIASGMIRLTRGLVRLQFDHGAMVTLEGPAVLEVVDSKTCRLHSGRAYSEISPGGEGFVVETPTGRFTDRGTVFGLNVAEGLGTVLSVFDGQVDVDHRRTGQKYSAFTNAMLRVSEKDMELVSDDMSDKATAVNAGSVESERVPKTVCLSTAVGEGADGFVQPSHNERLTFMAPSDTLLLKRDSLPVWSRRIYLRFDVSLVEASAMQNAELQLHAVDTAMGYLSRVSDTTVSVYGLTNESEDNWLEETLSWKNSPAGVGKQLDVDEARTLLLGEFVISPSNATGLFSINDPRLVEFLRSDTNGLLTLILTCGPESTATQSYVYGFASKSHPTKPAPSLRLTLSNEVAP